MSTDLFRLVYCSRNRVPAGSGDPVAELAGILTTSRRNNAHDGVTGALICSRGCFAQVLEGSTDAVQRVFERIECDPRHGDIVVLRAERIEERLFGAWDMALAEAADPAAAGAILARALAHPDAATGAEVVALLEGLVRREAEWACPA